jgi:D-glycero-D-manno-heptose 1,7-bisphosphate phosphatase
MLIILDRDGVINEESEHFIKSPAEWLAIPGSLEAIARLKKAGHTVIVASNQSGMGRGLYDVKILDEMHAKMQHELAKWQAQLDGIYYCPHLPTDGCDCRKPKPGMLWQIAADFNMDLKKAICIGDSSRDLEAGQAVGSTPVLVLTGNGKDTLTELTDPTIKTYENLAHFVNYFLGPHFHLQS